MRILVIQESDWIERGPHQSHHLLERLRKRGHQVRVIDFEIGWRAGLGHGRLSPRRQAMAPPKVVEGADIEVVRPAVIHLPILDYTSAILTHTLEIRRQLREFRPDVILGLGILNAFTGIGIARRAGVPFVYYLIDELHRLVPERLLQGVARVLEQANVRRATLILSINQALREYSIVMGARQDRAQVLPAGIDLERYHPTDDGSGVRQRLGIQPEDIVLFFMGWVYPFSGIHEVAEDLTVAQPPAERLRLLVVGKGDSWNDIARMAKERKAEDRITMVDFRPYSEMPSYLASADVCLLPAKKVETMQNIVPIKMYEYLASGKPVIATRLPGLVKEFGEGRGVLYVDDPHEVVPLVRELLRKGTLKAIGDHGRAFVAGNNWDAITDSFESYLKGLIGRDDGGA